MKRPHNPRAPAFDASAINATIQLAMAAAGLDTRTGPLHVVTETIRRALAGGAPDAAAAPAAVTEDAAVAKLARPRAGAAGAKGKTLKQPRARLREPAAPRPASFERHEFEGATGGLAYKVDLPASAADGPRALLVMLHGCTQSADDFAAGTQMNRLAEEHGWLVVYPEQAAQANASKCWNWFRPQDQGRDAGEPALIAGVVAEVVQRHGADPQRIFVAGLSAGAAMAVVLGETYPELFAGVGAHSGLPYASAHDVASAMAAMKGGRSGLPGLRRMAGAAARPRKKARQAVPTIVFHGDRDHTVQHTNGANIAQQAQAAHAAGAESGRASKLHSSTHSGTGAGGQRYTRTVHQAKGGRPCTETWTLHGAGNAWSGGDASGSYTDASGPDASAEMLRFFMALHATPVPPSPDPAR
jgi:poly(hydroxyalkanoate) depolymerase family esterase